MPKVTKKKAAKRQTVKKTTGRKAVKKKPARRGPAFFERAIDQFHRLTLAGVAGATIIVGGLVAALWAGGYVGMAADRADRLMQGGGSFFGF